MKFKPSSKDGGVLVELSPREAQLPGNGEAERPMAVFTLKNILVPVDFSECSTKALQYAIPFARHFGAEITLVHTLPYSFEVEMAMAEADAKQAAQNELSSLLRKIGGAVPCRALLRMGKPADEIVDAAKESRADLIILSTHGRSGLAHVFMGSTAERVVRHAPCPVLVVREKEHEFVSGDPNCFMPVI